MITLFLLIFFNIFVIIKVEIQKILKILHKEKNYHLEIIKLIFGYVSLKYIV